MRSITTYHSAEIFRKVRDELAPIYEKEAESLSWMLLENYLNVDRIAVVSGRLIQPGSRTMARLEDAVNRLKDHEPVQYIIGKAFFFGREFLVRKGVLIPRQETEGLVKLAKESCGFRNPRIIDIGCGTGCIAISLALEIPGASIHATDRDQLAIEIARQNAEQMNAGVHIHRHDIFNDPWEWDCLDVVVSNPPYVTTAEKKDMPQNVVLYEPDHALFVDNDHPLIFYEKIAEVSFSALQPGGLILVEINESFGTAVSDLFRLSGFYEVKVEQDLHQKDRYVLGKKR